MESIQILSASFPVCERVESPQRQIFVCFAVIENGLSNRINELWIRFFGNAPGPEVVSVACEAELDSRWRVNDPSVLFLTGVREDALYPSPEAPVGRRLLTAVAPLPVAHRAARHDL